MCGCATLLFESLSSLAGCSTSEGTCLVPTSHTQASHQNASCGVDLLCYERGVCRRRVGCTAAVATSAIQPILAAVQRAVARGGAHFAKAAAYTGGIFLYDFRPDPPWQRDGITLLAYVGLETLLRSAATGLKPKLGFDLLQLNAAMGGALLVATLWVVVATFTGVVGDFRYDRRRVLLTWLLAAPAAAALRLAIFDGFPFVSPLFVFTDAATTLVLMLTIRFGEEQGYL